MRRLAQLALAIAAAALAAGCQPPPHPSDAPRIGAYYTPTDERVLMADPARVSTTPIILPQ
jgi:hypothetical protein